HARTYIIFDAITTYLEEIGYDVFYLQNITDIDDKIIKRSKEQKKDPKELAKEFEKEYKKDMKVLKIGSITKYAAATDYIKEIQNQVKKLLSKDYAYEIEDGIYYNVSKFNNYGKLSGRTALLAEDAVSRIDDTEKKKNKGDFCLWKKSKQDEPKWKSPWGQGRPGWHIEDTAITEKYFGVQYDIHGGARDLIFPHHEAEIAQMEAISGKSPLVKYWLHTGFLTTNGQKMAKSLGNFITIRDFLKKYSPEVLRFFVFKSHYRSPVDFNEKEILQAKESLQRLYDFKKKIEGKIRNKKISKIPFGKEFNKFLEDDFNTPKFFSSVFDKIKEVNKRINDLKEKELSDIYVLIISIDKVFKIFPKEEKIPKKIIELANKREKYRKEKNWEKADEKRKEIEKLGYEIEDTSKGSEIKKR
ncbi:MAG: cysteine--tRNA ligase, partial [Candidatus Pacebacteria bacterium]|nr:cysteine--tRNA ligase [Candidatus Paceibacterota bacterium]